MSINDLLNIDATLVKFWFSVVDRGPVLNDHHPPIIMNSASGCRPPIYMIYEKNNSLF